MRVLLTIFQTTTIKNEIEYDTETLTIHIKIREKVQNVSSGITFPLQYAFRPNKWLLKRCWWICYEENVLEYNQKHLPS